jgi:hypothetical protein
MFNLRSISARLILTISLTVVAACAILGTFSLLTQRSLTRLALEQQLRLQYDSVIATIDYESRTALALSRRSQHCRRSAMPLLAATGRRWRHCLARRWRL